ncbi:MAG: DUF3592 domain-containing protein [Actinomycetia bacterium]|nr:DUF3592 domain-containing protein [Actinomycetes bacterium]
MRGGELVGHSGALIWVVYDPADLTRVAYDSFDASETSPKHRDFEKLTDLNEDLKKRGEPAVAVITQVDDLDIPYPSKNGRAKHLHFDVTPQSGVVFQAEGDFLIAESVVGKYSVGKNVFVRFDPLAPQRAALDSERNKTLS